MIPIEKAFELINQTVETLPGEEVKLRRAIGRVLRQDVVSDVDSPPHNKSFMDGFAVRSKDIKAASTRLEVVETIPAGTSPTKKINEGQCARIMTGAPVPEGADAVVMIEQTDFDEQNPNTVSINLDSIESGKSVMEKALTFGVGDKVFASGHTVRPSDVGLLAETGAHTLTVGGVPRLAFLPTGDELVDCSEIPGPAQIRNSNGPMLLAMAEGLGLRAKNLGIGRDDKDDLRQKIELGLEYDILVLSGGVSAGTLDLVPGILSELDVQQVFHKVAVKPGKPLWFGAKNHSSGRKTYVFGLPGNPVSSMVGFQVFVRAAIRRLMGSPEFEPGSVKALLTAEHSTRGDRPTYWPGRWIVGDDSRRRIEPILWRGSSDLRALGQAEALIFFPTSPRIYAVDETVEVVSLA